MNIYYRYSRCGDDNSMRGDAFDDFEQDPWRNHRSTFAETFPGWFEAGEKATRTLPWIGGVAIGLGILLILFPMLLVIAVAGLFFTVGAVCLSMWWQLRPSGSRVAINSENNPLVRLKRWFRQRLV